MYGIYNFKFFTWSTKSFFFFAFWKKMGVHLIVCHLLKENTIAKASENVLSPPPKRNKMQALRMWTLRIVDTQWLHTITVLVYCEDKNYLFFLILFLLSKIIHFLWVKQSSMFITGHKDVKKHTVTPCTLYDKTRLLVGQNDSWTLGSSTTAL